MELPRECPCPLLLVGPGRAAERPRIVAAVNASTDDAEEQLLNLKIARLAMLMARLEMGMPTLLQAWTPFAEGMVGRHLSGSAFTEYIEDARDRAIADLARLAQTVGSPATEVPAITRRSEPEDVIPAFVVDEGIDLVVMGTVGRRGVAGLLFGNTAERILRKLPCSVLAVKPDGFVSPVRPGAQGA